jgi:hypothetical protein
MTITIQVGDATKLAKNGRMAGGFHGIIVEKGHGMSMTFFGATTCWPFCKELLVVEHPLDQRGLSGMRMADHGDISNVSVQRRRRRNENAK